MINLFSVATNYGMTIWTVEHIQELTPWQYPRCLSVLWQDSEAQTDLWPSMSKSSANSINPVSQKLQLMLYPLDVIL